MTAAEEALIGMSRIIHADGNPIIIAKVERSFKAKGSASRDVMTRVAIRPLYTALLAFNEYFRSSPAVNVDWLGKHMFKPAGEVGSFSCAV